MAPTRRPQQSAGGPVERKVPSSPEAPGLVLMRDHFGVMLAAAIVFGSVLFAMAMFFIRGALSPTGASPTKRRALAFPGAIITPTRRRGATLDLSTGRGQTSTFRIHCTSQIRLRLAGHTPAPADQLVAGRRNAYLWAAVQCLSATLPLIEPQPTNWRIGRQIPSLMDKLDTFSTPAVSNLPALVVQYGRQLCRALAPLRQQVRSSNGGDLRARERWSSERLFHICDCRFDSIQQCSTSARRSTLARSFLFGLHAPRWATD